MAKFKGARFERRSEVDDELFGGIEVTKLPGRKRPSLVVITCPKDVNGDRTEFLIPVATFQNDECAEMFIKELNHLSIVFPK